MKSVWAYFSAFLLGSVPIAQASGSRLNKWRSTHIADDNEHALAIMSSPHTGNATFKQYIDHNNKDLGTFEQFYFYSTEFYGGPGSPVILFTPGEVNASA